MPITREKLAKFIEDSKGNSFGLRVDNLEALSIAAKLERAWAVVEYYSVRSIYHQGVDGDVAPEIYLDEGQRAREYIANVL